MSHAPEKFAWTSREGISYEFVVHQMRPKWLHVPAVFLYGVRRADGGWHVLYLGQTEDLARDMPDEPHWGRAYASGATNILVCVLSNPVTRAEVHTELLRITQPRMNLQAQAA